jgi:hypothetical protein
MRYRLVRMLLVVAAGLAGTARSEPARAQLKGADAHEDGKRAFAAGVALIQDPDGAKYEEAAAQFRRAYELIGSWKVLGNLALCLMHLERDGEAISAYEKYLSLGGKEIAKDERAQIERDLATLKVQVATVRFELPSGDATISDERTNSRGVRILNKYAATSSLQLGLHPGDHLISVRFAAGTSAEWRTSLGPASVSSHRFEPAPISSGTALSPIVPPPGESAVDKRVHHAGDSSSSTGQRTLGYVVGAAGVGAIGVGAVFGLQTFSKWSSAKSDCMNGGACDASGARAAGNLSTILFVAGAAVTAGGLVLVLTARPSEPGAAASAWRLMPSAGPRGASLLTETEF